MLLSSNCLLKGKTILLQNMRRPFFREERPFSSRMSSADIFSKLPLGNVPQSIASSRLSRELHLLSQSPIPNCTAYPSAENLFRWAVVIDGPKDTLYEGGTFFAEIIFGVNYPHVPPDVIFRTKIYHCNVNNQGEVCLGLRTKWKSTMGVSTVLQTLMSLFYACDPFNPLVPQYAKQYISEPDEYKQLARIWTQRYAS